MTNSLENIQFRELEQSRFERRGAGGFAIADHNGFTLLASLEYDGDADTSWLGEFSDTAGPHAIKQNNGRNTYEWFNPEGETDEERQLNYARMQEINDGDVCFYTLCVEVYKANVKLGDAYLGGVESDSGMSYFLEEAGNIAQQAIDEANTALEKLRA